MKDFSNFPAIARDEKNAADRKIGIAVHGAGAHRATVFENVEMTFDELVERLKNFVLTDETVKMWHGEIPYTGTDKAITSTQKTSIKDVGGFIGGHLNGERAKENIIFRSVWTADLEREFSYEQFTELPKKLDFRCFLYSTHSHRTEKPRVRIVAPFARDVSVEEYEIISEYLMKEIKRRLNTDADIFDDKSTKSPAQIMFFPSAPIDGTTFTKDIQGNFLDVDKILQDATEAEAQAPETRQKTSEARKTRSRNITPENPLEKSGDIGIFCRAFSVYDVLEKFLTDVYAPSNDKDRYTLIGAEGDKGLMILDRGLFCYSFHGTDKANTGHRLNAFSLYCTHLYDGKIRDALTAARKLPEFIAQEHAEKLAELQNDFTEEDEDEAEAIAAAETATAPPSPEEIVAASAWMQKLKRSKQNNNILPTVANCCTIVAHDPKLQGFALNLMSNAVEVTDALPWDNSKKTRFWEESDRSNLVRYLEIVYAPFADRAVDHAFLITAKSRQFNPLIEWLEHLPEWDRKARIADIFPRFFGAAKNEYTAAVLRKTMLAAITRLYIAGEDGAKFDYVPVLDGAQGIGKSTFWRVLAGNRYFTDALALADMKDKTGAEKIQGFWIVEVPELAGMRKVEIASTRAFITRLFDDYRPAYGHVVERRPRRCVIVATVNGQRGYLRDPEGDRRYWPIKCSAPEGRRTWTLTEEERQQLWAEAFYYYKHGYTADDHGKCEPLEMHTEKLRMLAALAQKNALEQDERATGIFDYLNIYLPENWYKLEDHERREYMRAEKYGLHDGVHRGSLVRDRVCSLDIWLEFFEGERGKFDVKAQTMIAQIMKTLSDTWEPVEGERRYAAGRARRGYVRRENPARYEDRKIFEEIRSQVCVLVNLDDGEKFVLKAFEDIGMKMPENPTGETLEKCCMLIPPAKYEEFLNIIENTKE